jgi:hypothetical protein
MKEPLREDEPERFSDDEGHPVAKIGLRSLREERAPESSMKATLTALRRSNVQAAREPRSAVSTFFLWALGGAIIAAVVAWLLFFR